jgi:hypothetical protein
MTMPHKKTSMYSQDSQIRNLERIRNLAEVFTGDAEITAMLKLLGPIPGNIDARFLEPACGNGNFLVAVLDRKLESVMSRFKNQIDYEFLTVIAVASIYGVDIDSQNIKEARFRMKERIIDSYSIVLNTRTRNQQFDSVIDFILKTNVIRGDMINGVNKIKFTEYSSPKPYKILSRIFRLVDLLATSESNLWSDRPVPLTELPLVNFWELSDGTK